MERVIEKKAERQWEGSLIWEKGRKSWPDPFQVLER